MASEMEDAANVRIFQGMINHTLTSMFYGYVGNHHTIVAGQGGATSILGKIIPTGNSTGRQFDYVAVRGHGLFEQVAEILTSNLNIDQPVVLMLEFIDYEAGAIMDLLEMLEFVFDTIG